MSKSKKKSSTQHSTVNTLNPWSQQQWQDQFNRVQDSMTNNPVQAYTGQMVAGLDPLEQQARSMYQNQMGSYNAGLDQSLTDMNGAGLQADFGSVADQYMNPYERQVIDATLADINHQNDMQNAATRGRAAASGAYGGNRVAVAEGINNEAANRLAAQTGANLRYQGYNDARGYYGQDIATRENRARYGADVATQRHALGMQDISGLNSLGEVNRGIEQDRLGAAQNDWLRQQQEQWQRTGVQAGLLGSIPMLQNQSGSSSTTETTNPGALGTLGQLGGLASMFVPGGGLAGLFSGGMAAAGAAAHTAPAAAGVFSGGGNARPSDIRVKTDIEPAGERGGHNWYRFRYVWDEPGIVQEGVMAQEVLETRPDAVLTHPTGMLMVNYSALGL